MPGKMCTRCKRNMRYLPCLCVTFCGSIICQGVYTGK